MLRPYLKELIDRITHPETARSSAESVSWHALREAEQLSDPTMIDELSEYVKRESDKQKRGAAYFIIGKLGLKCRSIDCARTLISASQREKDKYILASLLDRLANIQKPREVDLSPVFPLLKDTRWLVRYSAIGALRNSASPECESEIIAILDSSSDPDDIIYCNATLNSIGSIGAIPHIEKHMTSRKRDIKISGKLAIEAIMERHHERIG